MRVGEERAQERVRLRSSADWIAGRHCHSTVFAGKVAWVCRFSLRYPLYLLGVTSICSRHPPPPTPIPLPPTPPHHPRRCNQMHEVWVPTEFHRRTFAASGVRPYKLHVVPEPVDVDAFDPARHAPLPLPLGTRVFGPVWPHIDTDGSDEGGHAPFVFLSVFKWEARKVIARMHSLWGTGHVHMAACMPAPWGLPGTGRWLPKPCRAQPGKVACPPACLPVCCRAGMCCFEPS